MWNDSRNEKGMTLIEVLASIVILSIALLMLSNLLVRSMELSGKEDSKLVAMNLARQLAESWRSGNGDLTAATLPADLLSRYSTAKLNFQRLAGLTQDLHDEGVNEVRLPAVQVNGRTYHRSVSLVFLEESRYQLASQSMILITVRITSPEGQELALLQAAAAHPGKGGAAP